MTRLTFSVILTKQTTDYTDDTDGKKASEARYEISVLSVKSVWLACFGIREDFDASFDL